MLKNLEVGTVAPAVIRCSEEQIKYALISNLLFVCVGDKQGVEFGRVVQARTELLIMSPHAKHFDDPLSFENLIHQPVLDVDAARISTAQIAEGFLERRWFAEGIFSEDGICLRASQGLQ